MEPIVWLDMEMTGLDPARCTPVEVAVVLTDSDLREIEATETVIHQPDEALAVMEPVVVDMHTRSGLLERVRASTVSVAAADQQLAALLAGQMAPGKGILAGNSIHTDRAFVRKYFPETERFLHYRMIDVSSVKELVRRWYGEAALYHKDNAHTAMADVRESIAELGHYRRTLFRDAPVPATAATET